MGRNKERIITIATVVTVICCAVTIWIASKEIFSMSPGSFWKSKHINVRNVVMHDAQEIRDKLSKVKAIENNKEIERNSAPPYDTWETDSAIDYLMRYNKYLNNNKKPITADPASEKTITEWWQAAAMHSWYLNSPIRYNCKQNLTWYGGWAVCQNDPYTVKFPCLVYSFGIAYDFAFDDEIGKLGCDVRSFDPSMIDVGDHKRSANVTFYKYGLYDRNTNNFNPDLDEYVRSAQTWRMRTLKNIVEEFGHFGRTIDVLKIDIETTEWLVLDNVIETDMLKYVRHFLLEYHYFPTRPPKPDYVRNFQVQTKLRRMGFREYFSRPHSEYLISNAYRHQGEVFYINSNFQPKSQQMQGQKT